MSSFVFLVATIGVVNSFLFALLAWKARPFAREYRHAGTWLSVIFLCFGIALARLLYRELYNPSEKPLLFMTWLSVRWIYGPALLFYVRSVLTPERLRGWRTLLPHSVPFLLHFVVLTPLILSFLPDLIPGREDGGLGYVFSAGPVLAQVAHFFCYVGRMNTELFEASIKRIGNPFLEERRQAWIITVVTAARVTTAVFLALTLGYAFFHLPRQILIVTAPSEQFPFHRITAVYMFLLLHYTGYKGLDIGIDELLPRSSRCRDMLSVRGIPGGMTGKPVETQESPGPDDRNMSRYTRSSLSLVEAVRILARTRHHVETRERYLDADLTLDSLARELGLSRHALSQALNQVLQQNFSEFINSYRLERAQKLLRDRSAERINLIDVAFASGFRSKSSFNALFKRYCAMTPSEYRRRYEKQELPEDSPLVAL
ncbi:helix-turn-helix domain-containing protein [Alkalispirochaeta alkalica]|uniref:helix-turn-helix domain-containing protein n=1 Tax=Alkalispirochaeta alkalica TaxID=46356 RepID=UPI0003A8AD15|nr:helix-turn-helix transcriptional regulator [Alkalispirochaeta alkalica]